MRRAKIVLALGIWVAVLPYLGFPYSWKSIFYVLTGLALAYISYLLYWEAKAETEESAENYDNFKENSGFNEEV